MSVPRKYIRKMKHIIILNERDKDELIREIEAHGCTCGVCDPSGKEGVEEDPTPELIHLGTHIIY